MGVRALDALEKKSLTDWHPLYELALAFLMHTSDKTHGKLFVVFFFVRLMFSSGVAKRKKKIALNHKIPHREIRGSKFFSVFNICKNLKNHIIHRLKLSHDE